MKFLILLCISVLLLASSKPDKVSIQLMWLDQFQFAGYYVAKEKGFYKDESLDVKIKKFTYSTSVMEEVLSKRATFGIGRSSLIKLNSSNNKIVLISAIFQSSPLVLIALKSSNIKSVKDFKDKRIILSKDAIDIASILAMISSNGVSEDDLSFKRHTFNLDELIDGTADLYTSYISNEPYILEKKGIPYRIFSPKDSGFDFYSDILFTTKEVVKQNPEMVKRFKSASLKGWEYAFNHIDEAVDIIYRKYNSQNKTKQALAYEALVLKKLAYENDMQLGSIDISKIKRIFEAYKLLGFAKGKLAVDELIFDYKKPIFRSWFKLIDRYLYWIVIFILLVIFIFFYRQHILEIKNKDLEFLQKKLEMANSELESRVKEATVDLERAQEVAKMGSWIFHIEQNELKWSKQTYKIFEVDMDTTKNLYEEFLSKIHPQDIELVKQTYIKSLQEKTHYKSEHRLLMDDGSVKYVSESCKTVFDSCLKPLVSYGIVQDITEAVLAKQKLEQKDAYLLERARLIQMGEMLSMIAHQWRQPLAAITSAQINMKVAMELEKYDLTNEEEQKECMQYFEEKLDKIGDYTQNLSQIIRDFSDFYKPNKKSEVLIFDDVIKKAYGLIEEIIKSNPIEVSINLDSNYEIKIHENELVQVFLNLINNAREQLLQNDIQNASIGIKSYMEGDSVYLQVSDNAGGIDKKIINKIFDLYFSTKLEKNGTGLGLYLSKIIIKNYHGGEIYAQNSDNGAIFTVKLKRYKKEENEK